MREGGGGRDRGDDKSDAAETTQAGRSFPVTLALFGEGDARCRATPPTEAEDW